MILALILAETLAPDAAMLSSHFDLATVHQEIEVQAPPAAKRNRYRVKEPAADWDDGDDDGIEVKLRFNKVKLRMPIPSI